MLEGVFRLANRWLFINELRKVQGGEHLIQFINGFLDHLTGERERKLDTNHCRRLQKLFLPGGQPVDARYENRLHRRWDLERIERTGALDLCVACQRALLNQRLIDLSMKSGVPSVFSMIRCFSASSGSSIVSVLTPSRALNISLADSLAKGSRRNWV